METIEVQKQVNFTDSDSVYIGLSNVSTTIGFIKDTKNVFQENLLFRHGNRIIYLGSFYYSQDDQKILSTFEDNINTYTMVDTLVYDVDDFIDGIIPYGEIGKIETDVRSKSTKIKIID
jgi:hypothetical protein